MRGLYARARLALAMLMAPGFASAQPRALDVSDLTAPAFSVYTEQDGLSDEIWSTVGFDRRGFVWAGSASTLARFDGYRWTPHPFPDAHSLVRDLQLDAHGTLWAIFEREGLARYDGQRWSLYDRGPVSRHRFSVLTGPDGGIDLWVGHEHGFLHQVGDGWRPDPGDSAATLRPASIARTQTLFGAPREWLGDLDRGLWYREIGSGSARWRRHADPQLDSMPVTDVLRTVDAGQEELWVTSYGGGIARLRADGVRVWRAATGELPTESIYNARATTTPAGDRLLWIASRAGLLRVHGDRITTYDRRHGLPSDAVRNIKLQRTAEGDDVLWLATEGGLVRAWLAPTQWQTVSLHGARDNGIFGVLLEPDGEGGERLWVGSMRDGLASLQDGRWRRYTLADGSLPAAGVRSLARQTGIDGKPWSLVGLLGGTVLRIDDPDRFVPLPVPWREQPEESLIFTLGREHAGVREMWFATDRSGLFRLRDGRWTSQLAEGAAAPWVVYNLVEQTTTDDRRWLWAASAQGLARWDGERFVLLRDVPALPADSLRQVTPIRRDGRTELWLSSFRNGVIRLDAGDPLAPRVLRDDAVPPPPDPTVYSVQADALGRVYVCTNNGVQQLTPRAAGGYESRVFRRRDGLVHDECNTNSQQIDARGRYWVGTLGGLGVFDPSLRLPSRRTEPRPLHFTAARVDGTDLALQDEHPLALGAGAREVRIEFALLSGLRESESRYRSQLIGYDPDPLPWSEERSRSFTGLPPGEYRLRVEARDYAGTEAAPRELRLTLAPYWWQRLEVRFGLALALLLSVGGGVLLYNRSLRQRQRQLQHEVDARTLELHAANLRLTELSYLDPLTGLANRRRLMEAMGSAIARAVAQQRPIGLIVIDVDHFKRYNDRHGHLAGDAALRAVAQALQDATREQDLVARFGGEEFACLMLDAERDAVLRVAERMRALVEALPPRMLGNDEDTLTLSAGLTARVPNPQTDTAELLNEADAALYRAKHEGRNRVRMHEPGAPP
jgi:diguanylate cyclase (GGDEF)-like protein